MRIWVVLLLSFGFAKAQSEIAIVADKYKGDLENICQLNNVSYSYYNNIKEAILKSGKDQGIVLLSDVGIKEEQLSERLIRIATRKKLRIFAEFQKNIPGLALKKDPLLINKERAVVTGSDIKGLADMDILSVNNKEMLLLENPKEVQDGTLMVMGRVAGYDNAEYGLANTEVYPLLFHYKDVFLISTMRLSNAVSGRFGPAENWKNVFSYIINWLSRGEKTLGHWPSAVHPAYSANEVLDDKALKNSVAKGANWYYNARFLVHPSWEYLYEKNTDKDGKKVVHPAVDKTFPLGDGSNGILEGHASRINSDGSQPYRWWIRADCQAETAYALSSTALFTADDSYKKTAQNLLNYLFEKSNLRSAERNDPKSPSFGLIGWATTDPDAYYGDDNARALLAAIGASSNLMLHDWDEKIIEGIIGNYRTAGVNGFRGPWFRDKQMQKTSWQELGQREIINIHPHYESWLWALYVWMYDKTAHKPLLEKAEKAISITMESFPNWKWTNGIQQEYCRMILPLSWLIRVEDTPKHRQWLDVVVNKLLADMDKTGGIPEKLGSKGYGRYEKIASNAEYGTKEAPLISSEANKVSDLLYTMNFALFSLNEAAQATGDKKYEAAAGKIAEFLIRIQAKSEEHKDLDGAWFRAFDYNKWEYWASNADSDWGAWGTLTGWTQSWIINGLINYQSKNNLWDSSKKKYDNKEFQQLALSKIKTMLKP